MPKNEAVTHESDIGFDDKMVEDFVAMCERLKLPPETLGLRRLESGRWIATYATLFILREIFRSKDSKAPRLIQVGR